MSATAPVTTPGPSPDTAPVLEVHDLAVRFPTPSGVVRAVDGIGFTVHRRRTLCIVGESGSGKSVTSRAVLGLHRGTSAQVGGRVLLGGQDLMGLDAEALRRIRGDRIALVAQDSLSALHPCHTVGAQLVEAVRSHRRVGRRAARDLAAAMLDRVGIPQPTARLDSYPHEFSGGMRQRVMIAMALVNEPELVIADEPTTALDVTVQAQILDLFATLQRDLEMALVLVTHDLGVAARIADEVLVMYAGRCVEQGPVAEIFHAPRHPYTWGLLASMPRIDRHRVGRLRPVPGQPPSLIDVPAGCAFHPRCAFTAQVFPDGCASTEPSLEPVRPGHLVRCLLEEDRRERIWNDEVRPRGEATP